MIQAPVRRRVLGAVGAFVCTVMVGHRVALAQAPGAGNPNRKLVLIILRGAMDGLSAVPPLADPDYASLRPTLRIASSGEGAAIPFLRGFGLHPSLVNSRNTGHVVALQAVASPYRQRSHFDGQAMLELGTARLGGADGWLNRALVAARPQSPSAMAVGGTIPLVLMGRANVMNWEAGQAVGRDLSELYRGMERMYSSNETLKSILAEGLRSRGIVEEALEGQRVRGGFSEVARGLARIMTAPNGPSIAVMELGGWDTHVGQGTTNGRMAAALRNLDAGIVGLREGLGDAWDRTLVVCATEFGRTARQNGSEGTDHGTGGVSLVFGGALSRDEIIVDWPGLGNSALFEGRDVAPTRDIRTLFAALLGDHLKLSTPVIRAAFPDAPNLRAVSLPLKS